MAKKKTAGRIKVALAFALVFGPASLLVIIGLVSAKSCEHKFKQLPDLGAVSDYSFVDIDGNKKTSKNFKGDIVLATTLQVTCPNNCAISLINLNLQIFQLAKEMEDKSVKIISFVTDENGDPVDKSRLKQVRDMLKDRVKDFDPEVWILAAGSAKDLFNLKHEGRELLNESGEDFYAGQAYLEMMLLLDRSNHLRMIRSGKTEGMIREMKQHIALLQKQYDVEKHSKKRKK